jgi:aminopeptidase N
LNWFFNQWFLGKGHPELEIKVDYSEPENILVSITQQQDLTKFPLFQIPFEISWYVDGEREKRKFFLNKAFQQFALDNKMPVDQVYFDEEKNVLANFNIERNAESYQKQFLTSKIGIARYEALDSLVSMEANEELKIVINNALSDSFWAIRESALRIIQGNTSWLSVDKNLENKVFGLVENDLKNSVRAGAIDALASYDAVKYQQTFKRLTNDPSYLISGSALMGLMEEGIDLEPDYIAQFDREQNFRIVIPVADFYITKPIAGKGAWFHSQIKTLSGEGLYFYLGYYAEYFSRFREEGSEEAISNLFTILDGDEKSFIRLGAFQALLAFSDEEVVIDRLVKSTASESDPELKMYYQYFMEVIKGEN